jgi:hypothetical protein
MSFNTINVPVLETRETSAYWEQEIYDFWYSGYGGETDVSLDCGRFYGPFVRTRIRMSEGVNE